MCVLLVTTFNRKPGRASRKSNGRSQSVVLGIKTHARLEFPVAHLKETLDTVFIMFLRIEIKVKHIQSFLYFDDFLG